MSANTEAPFSLTLKLGGRDGDLLTGRANTAEEMLVRVQELRQIAAVMQGGTQPVTVEPTTEQAVQNLASAGITGTVVQPTGAAIEVREDKWGGKYMRGNPDAGTCNHGPRIVKDWTDKSGKHRNAYVCVNDSPFGNWKDGKCDLVWPSGR